MQHLRDEGLVEFIDKWGSTAEFYSGHSFFSLIDTTLLVGVQ
jgi:hypothetical protein